MTKNTGAHELLIEQGFANLDVLESGADDANIKKLIRGRIDVWPSPYFSGRYSARKMGVESKITAIPDIDLMSGHLYLAFNQATDDAVINAWKAGLDRLRAAGKIDKIIAKYQ